MQSACVYERMCSSVMLVYVTGFWEAGGGGCEKAFN